jgi:hypothetical protein
MRQNEARDDFDEDAIREIAYALWERRGAPIGSPEVDWIEAERQLRDGDLNLGCRRTTIRNEHKGSRRTPVGLKTQQ